MIMHFDMQDITGKLQEYLVFIDKLVKNNPFF